MTPMRRVGDIAEQIRGVTYAKSDASSTPREGYAPVLRAGNIGDGELIFDDLVYVPVARISGRQMVRRGDVLIAASSGSIAVVGKAAQARQALGGGFGAFCKVLRPGNDVDPGYFAHYFRTSDYRRRVSALAQGANINNLRSEHLDGLEIPLPPLVEQRRIAGILDAADGLRVKRRESITLLDTLTQSIFLDMFGDADPGWVRCVVLDAAADDKGSIRTGPFGSQLLHSEFVDAGVAVLGIDNAVNNEFRWGERRFITDGKYQELSRYRVFPGDVLITIMGTTGRCAVVPDDIPVAINTKHLCCISLNRQKCLPEYLHAYFLHHPDARDYLGRQGKGAIMVGLNMGLIKAMPLLMPPISLQAQFVARLNAVGQAIDAAIRASAEGDSLFATLQVRAFRGEL